MHVFRGESRGVGVACVIAIAAFGACRAERARPEQRAAAARTAPDAVPPASAAAAARAQAPAPPAAAPGLPPLAGEPLVDLPVPDHEPAVVSVPLGTTDSRPVVVATHGNFDRPEWQCEVWGAALDGVFTLCPRGVRRSDVSRKLDRWTYGGAPALEKEIAAGLSALERRFSGRASEARPIFVGFSLGAILGVRLLARSPTPFPRAVLIEGGNKWTAAQARQFAAGGGKKLLFVCAQAGCRGVAEPSARLLGRAGVAARVADAGNVGHTYDGVVAAKVTEHWAWLLAPSDDAGAP